MFPMLGDNISYIEKQRTLCLVLKPSFASEAFLQSLPCCFFERICSILRKNALATLSLHGQTEINEFDILYICLCFYHSIY